MKGLVFSSFLLCVQKRSPGQFPWVALTFFDQVSFTFGFHGQWVKRCKRRLTEDGIHLFVLPWFCFGAAFRWQCRDVWVDWKELKEKS